MINRNSFSRWCHLAAEKELKQHGVHSVTDLLTDQRVCVCCVGGLCVLTFSPSGVWVIPHRCVLFEALWRISSSVSNPHPNTIETSSCMRNRGLKRPAPSEILLSGTVSKEEEEEWPIPECHVTHWKVLKCPTTSKSGWQNLSWNYQKVNIKTTLYIFYPNYRASVSSSQVHPVGPNHSVRSQGNVWCIKFHSCFGSREPFRGSWACAVVHKEDDSQPHLLRGGLNLCPHFLLSFRWEKRKDILTAPPHILQSGNTNESYGTHLAACWKLKVMELDVCVCVFCAGWTNLPWGGHLCCVYSLYISRDGSVFVCCCCF